MDILIEDFGQGMERKIRITDSQTCKTEETTEPDKNPDEIQTIEYVNACRAIFQARQLIAGEQKER